jgi:hypothetical protein
MDQEQKMVVVNMDVGNRNAASKCLCFVQGNSLFDVENKKAKAFNPLQISKGNSTCMAYWKKVASKMAHVNDASLDPTTAALKGRLNKN